MVAEDTSSALYSYYCFNLNILEFQNPDHVADGYITIRKDCLVEPDIHEKIKRFPNGKKKRIIKRVAQDFSIRRLLREGKIEIENSRFAWDLSDGTDSMALMLTRVIFRDYQEKGQLPEGVSIFQ